jgi:dienelactone hydrolase
MEKKEHSYDTLQYSLNCYDKISRQYPFKASTIEEFNIWKKELLEKLSKALCLDKLEKCELKPETIESVELDGYRRDKVAIQTEKDVWMPFYILTPLDIKIAEKREAVIAIHGHGSGGKYAVAGREDIPLIKGAIEKYNYDYGVKLVKQGYIVFCPDLRGSGERRENMFQSEEKILESSCFHLENVAMTFGKNLMGMIVWDLQRLLDYIDTYEPCNKEKTSVLGFSGGGSASLWLSIMDDRIKNTVVSGFFHGFRDTILQTNFCSCNFVPNLWSLVDMGDLGALVAPRPLFIESGRDDKLNGKRGIKDVFEQVEITRGAYKLFDREQDLEHYVYSGMHKWYGIDAYKFLEKHIKR